MNYHFGSLSNRTDDFKKSHWFYIFLQKKRNLHYHKVNHNHRIGDSRTLQLKDENIIFEDKIEEVTVKNIKSLIYFGKLDVNPQYCPACGCVKEGHNVVKNGAKTSRITLTKVSGLPAYLLLRKQRYYCKVCASYFTEKSNIVGENCFISKRVKRMVMDLATKSLTLKHAVFPIILYSA
ncbi:hypothetical protein A6J77_006450 [Aerococcus viridans]|uniref:Transposase IS204/IS1001/IS1096/IS1165 zinc-finger domain-containing protein n=1 Tax=Aerococcus viridans TaxID=1377 RepID=A0A2J9PPB0_9LACT|nr:hypothetical protein A6J77_006450 [Aerococcus viridans]